MIDFRVSFDTLSDETRHAIDRLKLQLTCCVSLVFCSDEQSAYISNLKALTESAALKFSEFTEFRAKAFAC